MEEEAKLRQEEQLAKRSAIKSSTMRRNKVFDEESVRKCALSASSQFDRDGFLMENGGQGDFEVVSNSTMGQMLWPPSAVDREDGIGSRAEQQRYLQGDGDSFAGSERSTGGQLVRVEGQAKEEDSDQAIRENNERAKAFDALVHLTPSVPPTAYCHGPAINLSKSLSPGSGEDMDPEEYERGMGPAFDSPAMQRRRKQHQREVELLRREREALLTPDGELTDVSSPLDRKNGSNYSGVLLFRNSESPTRPWSSHSAEGVGGLGRRRSVRQTLHQSPMVGTSHSPTGGLMHSNSGSGGGSPAFAASQKDLAIFLNLRKPDAPEGEDSGTGAASSPSLGKAVIQASSASPIAKPANKSATPTTCNPEPVNRYGTPNIYELARLADELEGPETEEEFRQHVLQTTTAYQNGPCWCPVAPRVGAPKSTT